MESIFKILSLLIVVAGAFLVYGAKFIAKSLVKNNENVQIKELDSTNGNNVDDIGNENIEFMDNIITQKSVSLKKTGLLIIMAGCILVLIAFR
ncbi:MAG: hypothetical protein GX213_14290 [Clostridiaceae bacterium]|nr:hypothetical protein [Clostridiaceae bacterium]